ncbi:MAG TPA: hypothetical protein VG147_16110 [Solirubrobacteraceae bacterium]|jgi:hypothetical protein|nr:hypothetical protein [Solirubrobacteraceae bacterium]
MALAALAAQATPTQVNVRIEGRSETLFEGPILTEGHDVQASSDTRERSCDGINPNDPENVTPGPTPTAASVDAMSLIGETFDGVWYGGYEDYFITRWGPDQEEQGMSWGILVNNVFTDVGGCQYELSAGDEVLWVYNAFASRPFLALFPIAAGYTSGARPLTATAELGKPFEVEVVDYNDQKEDKPPADPERAGSSPYEGADVSPVQTSAEGFEQIETTSPETVKTNTEGKARITFTTPGWHRIKATAVNGKGEEDAIRSNRLDVCVPPKGSATCPDPFPEDQVRVPPHTAEEAKREEETKLHAEEAKCQEETKLHEAEAKRREAEDKPSSGPGGKSDVLTSTPGVTSPRTPGHDARGPVASLAVESVSPAQLRLKLIAPGEATVKIARLRGKGHHRQWQTIKTISVKANKAGALEVKLPRLAAGSYRVSVTLAGAKPVVKTLTVPRTRR